MKIKEVIRITELTDKAIRLYIDNGLVAPNIDESYSGRKSIEFSADDVERLNNIALLRKAGFSIADIKEIIESDEKAQAVVERFISETESNIQHETEIIEKLKNIPVEKGISLATICESLSEAVEEKKVPKEDIKLSVFEKTLRTIFCSFGVLGMLLSVVTFIIYEIHLRNLFIHPSYNSLFLPFVIYSGYILMFILSFALLRINVGHYFSSTKKSVRTLNSVVIPIVIVLLFAFTFVFSYISLLGGAASKTENPNKYLKFDSWVESEYGEKISSVFPPEIPETADKNSIKYFYRNTWVLDPDFDIIAEWALPDDEYNKTKDLFINDYVSEQKGNWTCYYVHNFRNYQSDFDLLDRKNWQNDEYWIILFAHNDQTNTVRYIASYAMDSYYEGPYYLTLDW